MPLSEVNGELVRSFEFYLKTEKECQQNTVIRYMKCLKKITNLALANEWITKDPFIGIKFHEKEVIREFLTMDELLTIYHKEFSLERITIVRDVFTFAAFTGLAFIDVQQLAPEHIVEDSNGNLWIANLGKRRRTCVTFLCLIFHWRFSVNMRNIQLAKRKTDCCQSPAIRR